MDERLNMSENKDVKPACGDDDEEEDLEMLRLMALQSRKNKTADSKPSLSLHGQTLDNESEDSDSSVDSLDKLIQDMDYELLDTPKEQRVYSKKKKTKKIKCSNDKSSTEKKNCGEQIIKAQTSKECSEKNTVVIHPEDKEELEPKIKSVDAIEVVGSRIPTLTETIPLNILNTSYVSRVPQVTSESILCKPMLTRSRTRSWSRESSPSYRRARFSRSPERRTPSRSIFPDLTNVQLSPRALAFVYNNTGILIKRRDRRSSSSVTRDYFSSDSSSRSRRSISPYPSRLYNAPSPQPSYSGQIHNSMPQRRSRSNSGSKLQTKQRMPYKPQTRVVRRQQFRENTRRHNRRRQRSCSISLSPSPEPVIKHPINFGRNNYGNNFNRNRTHRYDYRNMRPKINHTTHTNHEEISTKNNEPLDKSTEQCSSSTIVASSEPVVEQESGQTTGNEPADDGIELSLDASTDDAWSSYSSNDEREGRFKTKETAINTRISYSTRTAIKPPSVSLDELINKDKTNRASDENGRNGARNNRDIKGHDWLQKSRRYRTMRSPRVRHKNSSRRTTYGKSSKESQNGKLISNKVTSTTADKPLQNIILAFNLEDRKLEQAAARKSKESEQKVSAEDKNTEVVKVNKNNEIKVDEDLRDTLQQRRVNQVKQFISKRAPTSTSRLVESALIGAVSSQTEPSKRVNDRRRTRNEGDSGSNTAKKSRASDTRRHHWMKPDKKEEKDEEKPRSSRLPVHLRLGVGENSQSASRTSASRRRRNRGFTSKRYVEDIPQV